VVEIFSIGWRPHPCAACLGLHIEEHVSTNSAAKRILQHRHTFQTTATKGKSKIGLFPVEAIDY
jgi:hypothetical protein